jgi:hypothetical protein
VTAPETQSTTSLPPNAPNLANLAQEGPGRASAARAAQNGVKAFHPLFLGPLSAESTRGTVYRAFIARVVPNRPGSCCARDRRDQVILSHGGPCCAGEAS